MLRIIGRPHERAFGKYHRVLSEAKWSARAAGRVLLTQLVAVFAGTGPVPAKTATSWVSNTRPAARADHFA